MKKLARTLLGASLALVGAALAVPASADVIVTATLTKDKDVFVTIEVIKIKIVEILVESDFDDFTSAAEAMAVVNVRNEENTVDKSGLVEFPTTGLTEDPIEWGVRLRALIEGSVNLNTGIVGVNQDVGNMANQGNVLALAAVNAPANAEAPAFTHAESFVDQINRLNSVVARERAADNTERTTEDGLFTPGPFSPDKLAAIEGGPTSPGSINDNTGVIGVNQNAGNMNNQTNAVALSVGLNASMALGEAALGQLNARNTIDEVETIKIDRIVDSASNNAGIVSINQSAGNMNNQGSVVAFSALTASANLSPNIANP